jgi:hypothetical protein
MANGSDGWIARMCRVLLQVVDLFFLKIVNDFIAYFFELERFKI